MTSISTTISILHLQSNFQQYAICTANRGIFMNTIELRLSPSFSKRIRQRKWKLGVFCNSSRSDNERSGDWRERFLVDLKPVSELKEMVNTLPPVFLKLKRHITLNIAVGFSIAIVFVVIALKEFMARRLSYDHHGSVADLVKRGQLRSDRRGISKPLKYDDPFNNPLVRVGKSNSTVEMCGKVYRLAPVTLTEKEQSSHQRRRSRAYQWKRPTIFLKEGEAIPEDVDPETVRWIPTNHPFATTVNDIDEDLAQNNVYQKHGVPFRIRAEHEALQKKLEALQNKESVKPEKDPVPDLKSLLILETKPSAEEIDPPISSLQNDPIEPKEETTVPVKESSSLAELDVDLGDVTSKPSASSATPISESLLEKFKIDLMARIATLAKSSLNGEKEGISDFIPDDQKPQVHKNEIEQKLNQIGIDPSDIRDIERPLNPFPKPHEYTDRSSSNYHAGESSTQESDSNARLN